MIKTKSITNLFGNSIPISPSIDKEQLANALYCIFYGISLDQLSRFFTNEYRNIIEYYELYLEKKGGNLISLLYNPHRLQIKVKGQRWSIYEALQDKSFYNGLARASLFKKELKPNERFYQCLRLNINSAQYVNEFPPYIARKIGKDYELHLNSRVLDPCGGWGGRMIGLSTLSNNYTCFEPCILTNTGLKRLFQFIQSGSSSFEAAIHLLPFEDSSLENNSFDFALTSPPYYDTEEYTTEQTNSFNRYSSFEKWIEGFYFPMIHKTMKALKPGAPFIINIGNRLYPLDSELMKLSKYYKIRQIKEYLSSPGGLKNPDKGELFFEIIKRK